jgi:hypothetical protein
MAQEVIFGLSIKRNFSKLKKFFEDEHFDEGVSLSDGETLKTNIKNWNTLKELVKCNKLELIKLFLQRFPETDITSNKNELVILLTFTFYLLPFLTHPIQRFAWQLGKTTFKFLNF